MSDVDFFLKLDGIAGESADDKHKDEIDVLSWSWGASNSGTSALGGGAGAGKVHMQDFNFSMFISKATPELFSRICTGLPIPTAEFTARKAGGEQQEYLKLIFSDVMVSSYQTGGSGGGGSVPIESLSLNFTKVEFAYKPQKADGTLDAAVKAGYDIKANKKI